MNTVHGTTTRELEGPQALTCDERSVQHGEERDALSFGQRRRAACGTSRHRRLRGATTMTSESRAVSEAPVASPTSTTSMRAMRRVSNAPDESGTPALS